MGKIKTMVRLLKNDPKKFKSALASNIANSRISHIIPDKLYLKMQYRLLMDKKLNLRNPKTFNEKLQWIKLYNRNPEYCKLVDKYEVKNYIADTIGAEYIIPTLGIWDHFDDIDFEQLPNQFVLKCTHDSGSVVICYDKETFDKEAARQKLTKKLEANLFWSGREWPYKNVKPRIIAETFLRDSKLGDLRDYKFFAFDGDVKCFKIDFDRFIDHKANYFAPDGSVMPIGEVVCPPDFRRKLDMPLKLVEMLSFAERLSAGFPFLRVDFYEVDGKVYFGELTFFPASGFGPFTDAEWDRILGEWINLPQKQENKI